MKREEFQTQIKFPLLLDGATGSNLMAAGMPRGVCTEIWVRDHKDVFLRLQKAYIEAGSQVIYAPTFGGNRISLSMHGLENEIEALNKTLVSYSLEAADDKVLVAGDLTTTGKMMAPAGELSYEQAFEVYQEQIHYLAEAGVDLLAVETMISIEETLAALDAALSVCDLPVMCSMTIESDGSLFTGGNIFEAALAQKAPEPALWASTVPSAQNNWWQLSAHSMRLFPSQSLRNPMRECPLSTISARQSTI